MSRSKLADHPHDDGYYEDDAELLQLIDDEPTDAPASGWWAVLSGSYGVSIAVHVGILLVLATIVITSPPPAKTKTIAITNPLQPAPTPNPKAIKDLYDQPEIERPENEKPLIVVEEDHVEITEVPKGTDLSNHTNKHLDRTSIDDAIGIAGGGAGAYGQRFGKPGLLAEGGGPATESAVLAALRWLRDHQSPDGRWDTDGWHHHCQRGGPACQAPGEDPARHPGDQRYDVGVTALALLAFLGNGNTHRFGRFKRTVKKGLRWLRKQQKPDGSLGYTEGETIYNHAIATMALCEALAVSGEFTLRRPASKAVQFCLDAQNPKLGWRYGVRNGQNDTSVTGWMVLALKAAKMAKLEVPDEAFAGALRWFDRATDSQGRTGYLTPGGGSSAFQENFDRFDRVPCMTGVAVICRIFSGEKRSTDVVRQGARILAAQPPTWVPGKPETVNFYYWYYGTYAMFQLGGGKWKAWNEAMLAAVLPTMRSGGCEDGSWDPVGEWCVAGGRVYSTALNALTLEIYYRYERARIQ